MSCGECPEVAQKVDARIGYLFLSRDRLQSASTSGYDNS